METYIRNLVRLFYAMPLRRGIYGYKYCHLVYISIYKCELVFKHMHIVVLYENVNICTLTYIYVYKYRQCQGWCGYFEV